MKVKRREKLKKKEVRRRKRKKKEKTKKRKEKKKSLKLENQTKNTQIIVKRTTCVKQVSAKSVIPKDAT